MKKLVLALTAVAAFTGSALAADLPARTYSKAPAVVAPVMSWTGCYVSGGGGYGIYRVNHDERLGPAGGPLVQNVQNSTAGGDGWLATAGVGCDYQFSNRWVAGAFVDGTASSLTGDYMTRVNGVGDAAIGALKQDWSWAAGARVGYLVNPTFLSYVDAGFTSAHFTATNLNQIVGDGGNIPTGIQIPGQSFNGVFVGTGFEYALDFLPGLFVRSEGRANYYSRKDVSPICASAGTTCGGPGGPFSSAAVIIDSRLPIVYTAKTELVYRFNWGR